MANDTKLNLLLEARNNASPKIQEVQSSIGGLDKAAGVATKGVSGLMGAFAIGGISAFVGMAGSAIVEMSRIAAQAGTVETAFRGMEWASGESADGILSAMRRASGGTVTDTDLMLSANRAMMLGVASNTSEIIALMNVAATRGRAMGLSMSQAFNDIVTGLGRGSAMILDNLGIVVDTAQANAEYASQLGKTVSALSEAEKKQALVNSVMQEAAGIAPPDWSTAASDFARMESSIANAKGALGEMFSPAVAAVAQSIANAVEGAMQMADPNRGLSEAQITLQDLNAALLRYNQLLAQNSGTSAYRVDNKMLEDARRGLAQLVVDYNLAAMQLNRPIIDYSKLLAGQADFFVAAEQYNPAGLLAQQAEEARQAANAQYAQMASDAQAFADQNTSIWQAVTAEMEGLSDQQLQTLTANANALYAGLTNGGMSATDAMRKVAESVGTAADAMRDANAAANGLAPSLGRVGGELPDVARWLGIAGNAAETAGRQLQSLAGTAVGAALGLSQAAVSIKQAGADALSGVQTLNQAQSILAGINNANATKRGWAEVREEMSRYNNEITLSKGGAVLRDVAYMSSPAANGVGGVTSAVSALNKEFESLKSKAQGVLSGALNLDGINLDNIAPRPDAINENARRLAAIANEGLTGQDWFGEFASEVPDIAKMLQESGDPKAAAAQLLRDFQDGLVPQLIDKEQAKDRVRRMILGDQSMAAMAQEIAAELSAEMGISLGQAQQAVGTALGTGRKDGAAPVMDGNKEGNAFVDGVSQVLTARQQEFHSAGSNSGGQWGTGFLSSVRSSLPAALIAILIAAVRSGLADDADAQDSRTGAR